MESISSVKKEKKYLFAVTPFDMLMGFDVLFKSVYTSDSDIPVTGIELRRPFFRADDDASYILEIATPVSFSEGKLLTGDWYGDIWRKNDPQQVLKDYVVSVKASYYQNMSRKIENAIGGSGIAIPSRDDLINLLEASFGKKVASKHGNNA